MTDTDHRMSASLLDISRIGHQLITDIVPQGARVLDVGCDDGALMRRLELVKQVDARGVELFQEQVNKCVAQGLAVVQGDADTDLEQYPDAAFDYDVMSQVVQATRDPRAVVEQLLRIGNRVVVSFPNFAHWRVRISLALRGRMPVTEKLPYSLYDTSNIHFCSIVDFLALVETLNAHVEQLIVLDRNGKQIADKSPLFWKNLFGEQALIVLSKND